MQAEQTPFRPRWWGTGLESAGLGDVRPDVATYGRYDYPAAVALPTTLDGGFQWLDDEPAKTEWAINDDAQLEHLAAMAAAPDLPASFTLFLRRPDLQAKIRSTTACFLDVSPEPVPSPVGGGRLVRFLSDQQGCVYWYLWLPPQGDDHAVLSSTTFYGAPSEGVMDVEDEGEDEDDKAYREASKELFFCGESFEAFLCRYWLENEIGFFYHGEDDGDDVALPPLAQAYLEDYRRYQAGGPSSKVR